MMATNDFLLDELRYLRERSDKQVEAIIELRGNIADIEKTCMNIQTQITKMFFLVGGAALAGGAGGPLLQALMSASG